VLLEGLQQQQKALVNAARPDYMVGVGGRIYGDLTILGESQAEIMANMSGSVPLISQIYRKAGEQGQPGQH
jgi:hypothetical protein